MRTGWIFLIAAVHILIAALVATSLPPLKKWPVKKAPTEFRSSGCILGARLKCINGDYYV